MKGKRHGGLGSTIRTWLLEDGPRFRRSVLLGLTVGVPVFFLRTGSDPFNVPKLALLFVGVSVVTAVRVLELLQGAPRDGLARLRVPALALALPLLVSWLVSPYRGWALFGNFARFQGLLPYLIVILLGVLVADAFGSRPSPLLWALSIAGAVVGGYACIQWLGADPFEWSLGSVRASQTISTLGNPNFTGGFLGIVLPTTIALWFAEPSKRKTLARLGVPIVAGWILAQSEGGWAAGIAGSVLILGIAFSERHRLLLVASRVLAALVAMSVVLVVIASIVGPSEKFPITIRERGQWWRAAAEMGTDSPLFGSGPNSFAVEGIQHRTPEEAQEQRFDYTDDPHSVPMSLFAGAGILGLGGFLVVLLWLGRFFRDAPSTSLILGGFLAACVAYAVQALVSIDELGLRVAFWVSLGGLSCAAVESAAEQRKTRGSKSRKARAATTHRLRAPAAAVLLGLLVIATAVWSTGLVLADYRFHKGLIMLASGRVDTGIHEARSAIAFRDELRYRHLLGFEVGEVATESADPQLLQRMKEAFAYLPEFPDVPAIRDYARLLHESSRTADKVEAFELYSTAMQLDPFNPTLRVETAEAAVDAERYDEVETIVEPIIDEFGTEFPVLHFSRGVAYEELGRAEEAWAEYLVAVDLDPVNAKFVEVACKAGLEVAAYDEIIRIGSRVLAGPTDELPVVWGCLALAYVNEGNVELARHSVERALQIDPEQRLALEARRILDRS